MRIIIIHNKYKEKGGEDFVSSAEASLLEAMGHDVAWLVYDNSQINSVGEVAKLAYKSVYNAQVAKDLKKLIKSFKPDVIHVHNIFYIVSPAIFFVAKKERVPIVITLHNYRLICAGALLLRDNHVCEICVQKKLPFAGVRYKCHRNSYIQSLQLTLMTGLHKYLATWNNKVDRYIVLTEFAKQKVINSSLRLHENQVVVKANSTDDMGFSARSYRQDYFLFIGRLTEEKGIRVLLKSLDLYSYKVKIIGGGPLEDLVKEYAKKHENLEYLGFKDKDTIIDELKKSKALIFPSTWYEGMPLTILEAFSTGTPVICSNMNNLNDIVTDGYNGILFEPGSPQALVEKIRVLEQQPHEELYLNARKSYEEKYTPKANYENLMDIYEKLLMEKGGKM